MDKSIKRKKRISSQDPYQKFEIPGQKPGRTAFSGWPMIFGWLAMMIFAFHACTHMVAAGDTWVAMACGRHFVNHGVDTIEPFSANSHKAGPTEEEIRTWPRWAQWITNTIGIETVKKWHPTGWVNQNWLTHVIFYSLVPKSSYADGISFTSNALVYWKFAIYLVTVICVYYTCRLLGVNPALSAVFSCFAMFVGRSLLDVRPAGFSNMLVAVFLLILVLATYRNILYIWLIVPITVFWCNVHGGYIYVFITMVPFIGLHLFTNLNKKWTVIVYNLAAWPFLYIVFSKAGLTLVTFLFLVLVIVLDIALVFFKKDLVSIGLKGVYHSIAAYIVAFMAVVLFNPFHLTNLTHTFIISVSKNAERWRDVHEWHPAFDWKNPVGTAVPFAVMLGIVLATLGLWIVVMIVTSSLAKRYPKRKESSSEEYQWSKIDFPLMVIAALTIYMAIRSRRFIPIAAIAACPIIAMFIDRIIRMISAMYNFRKHSPLTVSPMPRVLQLLFIVAGAVAVLFFGTWWGLKFKRIYLDPWAGDPKLTSVFMRMTASDAKPFYAGKFIKLNKLKGKMFNYWTEGGFIAWAQEPDPNTGKTPLQLFMDGRAQAAYNRRTFDVWTAIMSGGPVVQSAHIRRRKLTFADYKEIGQWVDEQLKRHNVWVVLMPVAQLNEPLARGLGYNPDWQSVFFNNKQKLFVDITTPQGRELSDGVFNGKTLFPDEFSENLVKAHYWLLFAKGQNVEQQGLDFAFKAFNLNPSPAPLVEMLGNATRFAELRPYIADFCKNYVDSFIKNGDDWAKQHGYRYRIEAARIASMHLRQLAKVRKDDQLVKFYSDQIKKCSDERVRLYKISRW